MPAGEPATTYSRVRPSERSSNAMPTTYGPGSAAGRVSLGWLTTLTSVQNPKPLALRGSSRTASQPRCYRVGVASRGRLGSLPGPVRSGRRFPLLIRSGGCGIRTREGLHPTRFPSERHRPLGESSARKVTGKRKHERTGSNRCVTSASHFVHAVCRVGVRLEAGLISAP